MLSLQCPDFRFQRQLLQMDRILFRFPLGYPHIYVTQVILLSLFLELPSWNESTIYPKVLAYTSPHPSCVKISIRNFSCHGCMHNALRTDTQQFWFGSVWFGLIWLGFCELGSVSKHNVLEFESLCSFPLRRIDLGAATQYPLGIPEVQK